MSSLSSSWILFEYDEVESTQDVAREKIIAGDAGKKFVVRADRSEKGTGPFGALLVFSWRKFAGDFGVAYEF